MSDVRKGGDQVALVIDDTEVIRALLTEALEEKGYVVSTASDAREGIELATQLRPSLVFCDTYMPDLNGLATVRTIRRALPEAIVIMTNSLPGEGPDLQTVGGEFDFVLNKPFGLDELWKILSEIKQRQSGARSEPGARSPES